MNFSLTYGLSQTSQQNYPLGVANPASQSHKCHSRILGHFCSYCYSHKWDKANSMEKDLILSVVSVCHKRHNRIIFTGDYKSQRQSVTNVTVKFRDIFCSECNVTNVTRLTLWKKDYSLMFGLSQMSQQNNLFGPANPASKRHKCHSKILGHFCSECYITYVTRLSQWKMSNPGCMVCHKCHNRIIFSALQIQRHSVTNVTVKFWDTSASNVTSQMSQG